MSRWPRDNQAELIKFYGTPGSQVEKQLVDVVPPWQMFYEGKPVRAIKFHKLAAASLRAVFAEIWDAYGRDQNKINAAGLQRYDGAYNPRKVRGSDTKWSNHAFGAAIDINAQDNALGRKKGTMPADVVAAFKRQGFRWGGDYKGRKDWMHFEACDGGEFVAPVVESTPPKPLMKSKIAMTSTAVGIAEAGDGLSQISDAASTIASIKGSADQVGVFDILQHLMTSPRFLLAIVIIIAVGGIVYWRWRDHGKGSV